VELIRVEGERKARSIQRVHDARVYRYRDRLLPLVELNRLLQVDGGKRDDDEAVNIVVLQAADQQFGLVVDRISDTQEIVVKPLWQRLKGLSCFAGATVMGNGHVALILDVFGLAHRAGAVARTQEWAAAEAQLKTAPTVRRPSVLLVQGTGFGRMAIPLGQVARLEEFPRSRIERVEEQPVVQYRGRVLPLLEVGAPMRRDGESVQVVVCNRRERPVGLVVDRILDIVEPDADTEAEAGQTVIRGHVTRLLDVETLGQGLAVR
jgi:two-component system chemotaxis sensor kinase CheA